MFKKLVFTFVLVTFTFILQGCMPVTKPFTPVKVEADKALVYIYRPEAFIARGVIWVVDINGMTYSDYFVNNGYIPMKLDPGTANIELKEYSISRGTYDSLTLNNIEAGKTYYVKAIAKPFSFHKLKLMDNKTGAQEVSKTVYFVKQ